MANEEYSPTPEEREKNTASWGPIETSLPQSILPEPPRAFRRDRALDDPAQDMFEGRISLEDCIRLIDAALNKAEGK